MGRSTQVTTTPRYTKREKQAYQARRRRRAIDAYVTQVAREIQRYHFADNWGSRVPTANGRLIGEIL